MSLGFLRMKLFADDAKLYAVVSRLTENRVQLSLNKAVFWTNVWDII